MGVRTKNYSQIDSVRRIYVEGDSAKEEYVISSKPRKSAPKKIQREKLLKQQERIRRIAIAIASVICLSLVALTIALSAKSVDLGTKISRLENELNELTEQNDSKEYEINSTVDLDHVVQVATGQLGMVRSGIGQIQTYDSSDSEYTQQLAKIPTK